MKTGRPLVLLYIHDEESSGLRTRGGASKWWLGKSLAEHARRIEKAGGRLAIRVGAAKDVLNDVIAETGATAVFWNRRYGGPERTLDTDLKASLKQDDIDVMTCNGRLLTEPWDITTGAERPTRSSPPTGKP